MNRDTYTRVTSWVVHVKVSAHPDEIALMGATERQALLDSLRGHAPVVSYSKQGMALTIAADGTLPEAVSRCVEATWTACDAVGLLSGVVTEAKAVEFRAHRPGREPLVYLGVTECAMALEVSKQRIDQLITAGEFPAPDALVGSRKAWKESTIRRVVKKRLAK
jgi:predicted DNA-binding transcriptional regulator AlpA